MASSQSLDAFLRDNWFVAKKEGMNICLFINCALDYDNTKCGSNHSGRPTGHSTDNANTQIGTKKVNLHFLTCSKLYVSNFGFDDENDTYCLLFFSSMRQ